MVWKFAGQGTLGVGVGRDVYETEESYRAAMDVCDDLLRAEIGIGASDLLYPDFTSKFSLEKATTMLQETQ